MPAILLPVAAFVLCVMAALPLARKREDGQPLRTALVTAAILWAVWAIAGTELLSALGMIRPSTVAAWWAVGCAAGAAVVLRRGGDADASMPRFSWPDGWVERLLLAGVASMLLLGGISAIFAAPTTYDCLTYHLPRQIIWLQQGSVEHHEANNLRQTAMPPGMEFLQLQFLALWGSEALLPLLSWALSALVVSAASLVAAKIGAGTRGQLFAALIAATLPQLVVQSTSAKNDLVLALFLLSATHAALQLREVKRSALGPAMALGLSCGLALAAKGTSAPFLAALLALVAVETIRIRRFHGTGALIAAGLLGLSLSAGHFHRNLKAFGHPGGPWATESGAKSIHSISVVNSLHSPAAIVSNTVRNLGLGAGTPFPAVNEILSSAVGQVHEAIGLSPNDERTTFRVQASTYGGVQWLPNESMAGWPVLLALLLLALPIASLSAWGRRPETRTVARNALALLAVTAVGFVLFSAMFRWQIWQMRLLLPLGTLAAAPVGAVLGLQLPGLATACAALACIAQGIDAQRYSPRSFIGPSRELLQSRQAQLERELTRDPARTLTSALDRLEAARPSEVVFTTNVDSPDYPIMSRLRACEGLNCMFRYRHQGTKSEEVDPAAAIVRSMPGNREPSDRVVLVQGGMTREVIELPLFIIELPAAAPAHPAAPESAGEPAAPAEIKTR